MTIVDVLGWGVIGLLVLVLLIVALSLIWWEG